MKFWRVEDAEGVGMHRKLVEAYDEERHVLAPSAFNLATAERYPYDDDLAAQCPPEDDARLMAELAVTGKEMAEYIFAFSHVRQMRDYLHRDSWIRKLDEFGMLVSTYWVTEGVVMGDTQALIPKESRPLLSWPIGEYFGV